MKRFYKDAKVMFLNAVLSVQPKTFLRESVRLTGGNTLMVNDVSFRLRQNCHLVGFGKAVMGMAMEMERLLGVKLQNGLVTVPKGIRECFADDPLALPASHSKVTYIEGADNNLPDADAMDGAQRIKDLCDRLDKDDTLFVLISGGGSALLPLPKPGITLEEKLWLIKELTRQGADILELNTVRKKISQLKGGGLALSAYPCQVISLVLSDIIGDPLDFIASGPTVRNLDEPGAALGVLKKYGLETKTPQSILNVLIPNQIAGDHNYTHVSNFVLGNNKLACSAAMRSAHELGYETAVISTEIEGNVEVVGRFYAELAAEIFINTSKANFEKFSKFTNLETLNYDRNVCLIFGGETTVVLSGNGRGGRNQQLALIFAREIRRLGIETDDVVFLSCGTDGIDGPTDAAGALGSGRLYAEALQKNINPDVYLENNDSYNFYKRFSHGQFLITTNHTGTNVMDLHILIINLDQKCQTCA